MQGQDRSFAGERPQRPSVTPPAPTLPSGITPMQPWEVDNWQARRRGVEQWHAWADSAPPNDRPGASERPWRLEDRSPGIRPPRSGPPTWAVLSAVVGVLLLVCCGIAACAVAIADDPAKPGLLDTSPSPVPAVAVAGICHSRAVGSYSLVASVRAHNSSAVVQRGSVWVSWPVTGEGARMYSRSFELAPGEIREFHVDQPIDVDRWMRLGRCDYGWTGLTVSADPGTD